MNAMGRVVLLLGALSLAGMSGCKKEQDPVTTHRIAGDKLLSSGEFSQAAVEYGKALEIDPKQEKLWEKKAYAHKEAGELDQADAALLKIVELKPDAAQKAEVFRNIAGMYMQMQNIEKAEKFFNEALKVEPNDDLSLGWLGEIYSTRGGARNAKSMAVPEHLDKALEYYNKAIALKPDNPTSYVNKRIILAKYVTHEQRMMEEKEREAKEAAPDKAKVKEATEAAEKHKARMAELRKEYDELTKKIGEVSKKAKEAAAAASAAPAATQ